jgi:hypothetical protein
LDAHASVRRSTAHAVTLNDRRKAGDRGHRSQAKLDDCRRLVGDARDDQREQGSEAGGRARLGQTAASSGRRF